MTPDEVKKRKACTACTKAKAKCSPSGNRTELCQRCERLNKECVYEDSARKRGPKTRSRLKQLERRVESLVGLLVHTNGTTTVDPLAGNNYEPATNTTSCIIGDVVANSIDSHVPSGSYVTPGDSPGQTFRNNFAAYDPIDGGLIDEAQADVLLNEFRDFFSPQFPFVVVDALVNANTLRQQQPFLFLSIMAATTYKTPAIQGLLAEKFRNQVAARTIGCSHKDLEILQGLLVHAAFYQFFYRRGKQQLALMVQLCVATVQDLKIAKNTGEHHKMGHITEKSPAEKRALLGTYYLAAQFAHAWRKRTTMPYTRSLAQYCQSIAERPEHPSDALIAPLVHLSELMCRISDYFSYDEIAYSEITGESTLNLSTGNFRSELQRLQGSMPELARQNTTVRLTCDVLSVWIHECSLHDTLWHDAYSTETTAITPVRARMLQRTLSASQAFLKALIAAPSTSLHHYAFPIWGDWFYATLVTVKLILLHDNGASGALGMGSVPREVSDLLHQKDGDSTAQDVHGMPASLSSPTIRDSAVAAREAEVIPLFQEFIEKVMAAAPTYDGSGQGTPEGLLMRVATLQRGLIAGLKKRIEKQSPTSPLAHAHGIPEPNAHSGAATAIATTIEQQCQGAQIQPMQYGEPPDFTDLDGASCLVYPQVQQPPIDDWMWDLVMEDVNMFTL